MSARGPFVRRYVGPGVWSVVRRVDGAKVGDVVLGSWSDSAGPAYEWVGRVGDRWLKPRDLLRAAIDDVVREAGAGSAKPEQEAER